MKCIKCDQRKGKRSCPALNTLICAQCCGEKRVTEIPCTLDCKYFAEGVIYEWKKQMQAVVEEQLDQRKGLRLLRSTQDFFPLFFEIEKVILDYAADLRTLSDRDVLDGIQALRETYSTESRGVIYESSSANPLAQGLVRDLRGFFEDHREKLSEKGYALRSEHLVDCLEVVEAQLEYCIKDTTSGDGYLKLIARRHPDVRRQSPGGGIILAK